MDLSEAEGEDSIMNTNLGKKNHPRNIHRKRKYLLLDTDAVEECSPEQNEGIRCVSERDKVVCPHDQDEDVSISPYFKKFKESCASGIENGKQHCSRPGSVGDEGCSQTEGCKRRDGSSATEPDVESSLSEKRVTRQMPVSEMTRDGRELQDGDGSDQQFSDGSEAEDKPASDAENTNDDPSFEDFTDLDSEEDEKSEGEELYCKLCDKTYSARKSFKAHRCCQSKEKQPKRFCRSKEKQACKICNKVLFSEKTMNYHMKRVHMKDEAKPHLCDICGRTFLFNNILIRHMQTHSEVKPYVCEVCDKSFTFLEYLERHLVMHSDKKRYSCEECGQNFRRLNALQYHARTHTNERPYECDVCGKRFTQTCSLKTHQRMHTGEKLHSCSVCKERFARKFDLQSHMRTHTKEKPFHCDTCNKDFTQASSLKTHMRTHDKNKSYLCTICGETFALKNTLVVHMMRHKGEKPHKCTLCQKGFTQTSTLKTHMQTHTNNTSSNATGDQEDLMQDAQAKVEDKGKKHKCEVCGSAFALKNTLKIHLMRHTGEKPHKCQVCPKSFTQSSTLKIHMRTHTGDKPYSCDICGMKFAYSYALEKHNLIHKGNLTEVEEEYSDSDENGAEWSSSDRTESSVSCNDDVAIGGAALEDMRMKIVQTINRSQSQEEDGDGEEEEVEDKESDDCDEATKETDSNKNGETDTKKVTYLSFLSAFKSSLMTGDKPYSCDICGMKFAYKYALEKHSLTHKGNLTEVEEEYSDSDGNVAELSGSDRTKSSVSYNDDVAIGGAALEDMRRKIVQTNNRSQSQEEDGEEEEVEDKESDDCDETTKETDSNKDGKTDTKKVTYLSFLSAFKSSLMTSTGEK